MAIELGRININDLAENNYKSLGVGFGRKSNSNGIFAVNYTTLTQAKDNLVNLILTKKGEREMQPDFGCDIHNLIFEQIVEESIATDIENSILDAVNIWLPYINVDNIIFDYDENDIDANRITLEVKFSLKSNPSLTETLNVSINN
jgi:phage baseplate assembly protein W